MAAPMTNQSSAPAGSGGIMRNELSRQRSVSRPANLPTPLQSPQPSARLASRGPDPRLASPGLAARLASPGPTKLVPRFVSAHGSFGPLEHTVKTTVVPAKVQDPEQNGPLTIKVEINRASGESLGLGMQTDKIKEGKLVVDDVHDGPCSIWNSANPESKVSPGDQIVSVNGYEDFSCMLAHLRTSEALYLVVRPVILPKALEYWMRAAEDFELNEDFDIGFKLQDGNASMSFSQIMKIMKAESAGKKTIQALGDKIILSQMMENLSVPQMPFLFWVRREVDLQDLSQFVDGVAKADQKGDEDAYEICVKPTHLSSGKGANIFSKKKWHEQGFNSEKLHDFMQKYLAMQADASESEALKSLIPGFIIQPKYRSNIEFPTPLEVRVVTLWGKARLGIWWWGRPANANRNPKAKAQRTAWIVRTSEVDGLSNDADSWEVLHEHMGDNKGFEKALEIFKVSMPAMAQAAEAISKAVGAPFLRSDFFVGSEKYGVRLNEVAYGSGVECRRKGTSWTAKGSTDDQGTDDLPVIARILQAGFSRCTRKNSSEAFLAPLGALGETYEEINVAEVTPTAVRPRLPTAAITAFKDASQLQFSPIGKEDCETTNARDLNARMKSSNERFAAPRPIIFSPAVPMPFRPLVPLPANAKLSKSVTFGHLHSRGGAPRIAFQGAAQHLSKKNLTTSQ